MTHTTENTTPLNAALDLLADNFLPLDAEPTGTFAGAYYTRRFDGYTPLPGSAGNFDDRFAFLDVDADELRLTIATANLRIAAEVTYPNNPIGRAMLVAAVDALR